MNKLSTLFTGLALTLGLSTSAVAEELISHNFDDGNLAPFNACSVKDPNYTTVENGRVKTYWQKEGYNGTRSMRGAELCGDEVIVRKHGWYGLTVNLGADYQTDKQGGIGQVFQFSSETFWSWVVMLDMTEGDLTMTHRGPSPGVKTDVVLYPNFPKQKDMDIVIGFTLSGIGNGEIQVWVNGESKYHAENISLGFGTWDSDDVQTGDHTFVTFKAGMYNFQAADYAEDETETVYYDNITWYNGPNGYDLVDPSNGSSSSNSVVSMRKANSSTFAIDGNNGAANAQNVYLWTYKASNKNQHWEEIDRGNGFYSYKKYGTNYCLDGNNGGENAQSVYLWECVANNKNQHWKKVQIGSRYRLEKRNAPGFSIDGNRGGANAQDLYLWESSDTNKNQQWIFENVN